MLCQHCKKNTATYNRVDDINGEVFKTHLCQSCYLKLFGGLNSLNSVGDINALLFGSPSKRRKTCPVCGTTYADYEQTGLLGCASCYDVFKEELLPAIDRIHGKTQLVGKRGTNNDDHGLYRRLKALQEQLEVALRNKQYVEAGRLNKRIDEITKTLYGGGNGNG